MRKLPLHSLTKYFSNLKRRIQLRSQAKLVESSQLFDTQWYLEQYPDVAASGVNPLMHFLLSGAEEGRDPSPLFDMQWYFEQYHDVAESGVNPLVHYLKQGAAKGYDPNPLFDSDWYFEQYPDVDKAINPLGHYISFGAAKNYDPSPFFSTKEYLNQNPDIAKFKINPLAHYFRRATKWLEQTFPEISTLEPVIPRQSAAFPSSKPTKLLFVGFDASSTGAPVLLLNTIRRLKESFDIEPALILLTDGPMESDFCSLVQTHIVERGYPTDKNYKRFKQIALSLRNEGYTNALCNTAATGLCTEILYQLGFTVVSAIHEMPSVITAMKLEEDCKTIANFAHKIIFPAKLVRSEFEQLTGDLGTRTIINPQGLLLFPSIMPSAKQQVYDLLNIPPNATLILGAGRGDLRKGFDLYLQLARYLGSRNSNFHFLWIGNMAFDMEVWFRHDMETKVLRRCFHHIPFTDKISLYYQAADIFVLPSREDPFPSVVIDALAHGTPVVAFDNCGGYVDLLASSLNGNLVPYADIESMASAIQRIAENKVMHTAEAKKQRAEQIIKQFDFKRYTADILQLFDATAQTGSEKELSLKGS